ncbi:RHS repeat-associated core domain-containing protein [Streptomyces mirabilis]|uniref:RHS repeat-associated core domain-containing protein n=1 Tax=Streptomyces mirabilis TaxID=68239 RepID=UPI0036DE42EA
MVVDTCSTDATQKWRVTTTGTLVNAAKNTMCLSDPAASATKVTQLTLTACGGKGQNWSTIAAGVLPPGQTQTFTYDAEGRTATVSTPSGATDRTSKYLYDADGNLLEQTASVGGTDKTRVLYLFGGVEQLTLDVAAKTCTALRYYAGPDGTRITRSSSGGVTYQVANAQGTATTAVDASTLAATRRFYDPYGNSRGTEPPTWVSADENHGFLGMPGDPATGLDLLGARNYDPVLGRFLTPDPIFQVGDPNQMGGYTYAADNPATGSDPTGYDDWAHSDLNTCAPGFVCGGHTPQKTSSPAPTNTSSGNSGNSGGGGGGCHGFFGCTGHYLKKAAPYVAVGMVATVVIIGAGSCTLESGGLLAPGCIEGGAAGFTAACGAFLGDCGPGPGGDPTAEDAGEDTPRTEDANAAAKAGASTEAVDEAAADAKDLADMKRANAQAHAEEADAAAARPRNAHTGTSGTEPGGGSEGSAGTGSTDAADEALRGAVHQRYKKITTQGSPEYQSNNARGPVLTGAMDNVTGKVTFGQNTGIPNNLHPVLQDRLDAFVGEGEPFKGVPGSHSEINALNEGLWARTGSTLEDFTVYNVRLKGTLKGQRIARCANCMQLTDGVREIE